MTLRDRTAAIVSRATLALATPIHGKRGGRGFDGGLLNIKCSLFARDGRPRRRNVRFRLIQRDDKVALIYTGQDLSGLYAFIVAHKDFIKISGHARGNSRVIGLDIGVVRQDLETADRPVLCAVIGTEHQDDHAGDCEQPWSEPVGASSAAPGSARGNRLRRLIVWICQRPGLPAFCRWRLGRAIPQ